MKAKVYYWILQKDVFNVNAQNLIPQFLTNSDTLSNISLTLANAVIPLPIVSNINFNQPESYVTTEVIGGTGVTIHTGRRVLGLSLTATFPRAEPRDNPWRYIEALQKLKQNGSTVNIGYAPDVSADGTVVGAVFPQDFVILDAPVSYSTHNTVSINITLQEQGRVNIQQEKVNLVNLAPAIDLKKVLTDAGFLG